MWEQVALLALGALFVKFLEPWIDRVKARTASEYWETQERWRFKADVYSRALSALDRMRQPLEMGALRGRWPEGEEWQRAVDASLELNEAASRASIWLPEEAVKPLRSQGDRLLQLRNYPGSEKQQLLAVCSLSYYPYWFREGPRVSGTTLR